MRVEGAVVEKSGWGMLISYDIFLKTTQLLSINSCCLVERSKDSGHIYMYAFGRCFIRSHIQGKHFIICLLGEFNLWPLHSKRSALRLVRLDILLNLMQTDNNLFSIRVKTSHQYRAWTAVMKVSQRCNASNGSYSSISPCIRNTGLNQIVNRTECWSMAGLHTVWQVESSCGFWSGGILRKV